MSLACVDVAYGAETATAACLLFPEWSSPAASAELVASTPLAAPYRPGEFYLRELPAIRAVLSLVSTPLEAILVDGYVWLDGGRPGLGARLHDALSGRVPVVGVAKTAWAGAAGAPSRGGGAMMRADDPRRIIAVRRGKSARPLFVTAVGLDVAAAAAGVAGMHGQHRIPTLLKAVDRRSRAPLLPPR